MNQPQLAPPAPDSSRSSPERRTRHGLIEDWRDAVGILLLLVVAAFFGAILSHYWPGPDDGAGATDQEMESRIATLESRFARANLTDAPQLKDKVTKLELRLAGLEQSLSGMGAITTPAGAHGTTPTPGGIVAPFSNPLLETARRVDDLGTRLTALEGKLGKAPDDIAAAKTALDALSGTTTGLATRMDNVATRLEKLESSDLLALARRASLASSIANLTRAAQGSSPFKTEYDIVAGLLPGDARLQQIAPYATAGLPTVGTLISSFGSLADAAMDADNQSRGKTWWTRLWANFASLVSWRSTAEQDGSSTESRLARAGIRLKAGDLAAAVRELDGIHGNARKPLAAWLERASSRVRVEATLATLNSEAIEAITGPTDSSEPVPQLPMP
jgi:hypothetical protein